MSIDIRILTQLGSDQMKEQTPLFWNNQGAIACEKHAPSSGSDTWRNQQWQPMSSRDRAEWSMSVRRAPQCECCK